MNNSKIIHPLLTCGFHTPQEFQNINVIRFNNNFDEDIAEEYLNMIEVYCEKETEKLYRGEDSFLSGHKNALERLIEKTDFGNMIRSYYQAGSEFSFKTEKRRKTSIEGEVSFTKKIIPLFAEIKAKINGSCEKETSSSREYTSSGYEIPTIGTWLVTATLMIPSTHFIERISDKNDLLPVVQKDESSEGLNNISQNLKKMKQALLKDILRILPDIKSEPSRKIDQLSRDAIKENLNSGDSDKIANVLIKQTFNSSESDREKIEMALNFVILSKCYEIAATRIEKFLSDTDN